MENKHVIKKMIEKFQSDVIYNNEHNNTLNVLLCYLPQHPYYNLRYTIINYELNLIFDISNISYYLKIEDKHTDNPKLTIYRWGFKFISILLDKNIKNKLQKIWDVCIDM